MKSVYEYLDRINESPMLHDPSSEEGDRQFSKEYDWGLMVDKDLLEDNISANNYKLYKTPSTYWLSDKTDEYLGHISGDIINIGNKQAFLITETYSKLNGGFYLIMFTHIFKNSNCEYIFSDRLVSIKAMNSWKKRLSHSRHNAVVLIDGAIKQYDDDGDYWGSHAGNIRVGMSKNPQAIEIYEMVMNRCHSTQEQYSSHRKMYLENSPTLDKMLYESHS